MLAAELVGLLHEREVDVTPVLRQELDITDRPAVHDAVGGHDVVVNAAAWTDVDGAEDAEQEAYAINADGVGNLAGACTVAGARLVQMSTDYVFDGSATSPYAERSSVSPINAYGRTKLAGERAALRAPDALVVRTSWLYGSRGANFVRTIARIAQEREKLDVVDDQWGQPTWTRDVATRLVQLIDADIAPGIWHATNADSTTWCGLARAVLEELGDDPARVRPVSSDAFPRRAQRPAYSVLGDAAGNRAGVEPMRPWRDALTEAAPELFHQLTRST